MTQKQTSALISIKGTTLTEEEKSIIKNISPIGFTFFNRNIENKKQLKELTETIKNILERDDIIFAVDQEGGRVRRLREPEFRGYTGQETIGRLYTEVSKETAQRATYLHAALISQDLRECGLNLNYAPVADIIHPDTSVVIKSRCFSSNAEITTQLSSIMIKTYIANGIIPCIKHLPGHGRAEVDPHLQLPRISSSLSELETDFFPFKELSTITPCGMSAHIVLEKVDSRVPITLSPVGIKTIIRETIGFDGFLISDSIDMNALSGTIAERAQRALEAGCDAYCYCGGKTEELKTLAGINASLSPRSEKRLKKLKKILKHKISRLESYEEYQTIIGKITPYEESYDATEVLSLMERASKQA